ncbi:GNAT family N-acetyltransferase [Dyella dinghuensis]|uniref:GNAT family N-acetyltransferase n=1 Tax=Dyella dinghuensis TaxID=1920169 RepID=A0A3S0S575_9GAMM|nr:GNAT family N-acetyltransferase [Dyella dinghuensis]RUL66253.1 GNAT family N-acetyltransferase [Dyella dinghuensis]
MAETAVVRRAHKRDAEQIAACLSSLGYGTTSALVQVKLDGIDDSRRDVVFVCQFGDSVVGVVSLHAIPLFHTSGELVRITSLAVLEGWFRKGVGAMLIEASERWGWSVGAARIEVTSGDHRDGAHRFYEAMGYFMTERRFIKSRP